MQCSSIQVMSHADPIVKERVGTTPEYMRGVHMTCLYLWLLSEIIPTCRSESHDVMAY